MERAEGTSVVWKKDRLRIVLTHEVYKGDLLTNKTVTLDYLHPKSIRNHGEAEQYYIEQHHEPLVDPEVFDAVQEYFKAGLLQEPHFLVRQAWFAEHPEILKRREENTND